MKKINKGFVFYLLVLLGILFVGFLVCVCILIFSPGTSIFGLKYYKVEKETLFDTAQIYTASTEDYTRTGESFFKNLDIENLVISSNAHSIKVFTANSGMKNHTEFHVTFKNSCTGFTTDEIINPTMRCNYYSDTKTLELVAKVPQGFWNTGNTSSIEVKLPFDKYDEPHKTMLPHLHDKFNLIINAGSGSVTIGDSKTDSNLGARNLYVKSLKVKTTGSVGITDFGHVGTASDKGECVVDAKSVSCATTMYATDLKIKSGNIFFGAENSIVASGDVNIDTENSTANYGNISATKLLLKNIYGSQKFNNVKADVLINNSSKKCDYNFNSISGKLSAGEKAYGGFKEIVVDNCNITVAGILTERDVHTSGKFVFGNQKVSYSKTLTLEVLKNSLSVSIENIDYELKIDDDTENNTVTFSIVGDGGSLEKTITKDESLEDKTTKMSGKIRGVKFEVSISEDGKTWTVSANGTRK
ncbi:MAG: hypothetical protein MR423_00500 [Firmicutes bacterium]|nr:hypothetical protein [Bacillota bacterium]MDY3658899.1 hypothetical protein [Eubacteriales bacterium]